MYIFFLPLFIPLLRTESSSTWRASTTRRLSTTLFWLTADTHTLTRTHSITATLGDAERGTAYRLASADRNHSCSPSTFPPSPLWLREPGSSFVPTEDGRADRGPETSSFHSGAAATQSNSPQLCIFLLLISTFPFLHDFCSQFGSFSIMLLSVFWFFLYLASGQFLFYFVFVGLGGDAIAMFIWPRLDPCSQAACGSVLLYFFFFFLQFIYLRTNGFSFCAILLFFSFWN